MKRLFIYLLSFSLTYAKFTCVFFFFLLLAYHFSDRVYTVHWVYAAFHARFCTVRCDAHYERFYMIAQNHLGIRVVLCGIDTIALSARDPDCGLDNKVRAKYTRKHYTLRRICLFFFLFRDSSCILFGVVVVHVCIMYMDIHICILCYCVFRRRVRRTPFV